MVATSELLPMPLDESSSSLLTSVAVFVACSLKIGRSELSQLGHAMPRTSTTDYIDRMKTGLLLLQYMNKSIIV